jgi:mRNA-degrading endonuclease HigB of HigAB toxin-antitoxin module
MKSSRTKNFRKLFDNLPERIKETAKKNYELWKEDRFHSGLEFKKVKPKENIWSVRVGIGWRALGVMKADEEKIVWFWIGSHAEYDKIVGMK